MEVKEILFMLFGIFTVAMAAAVVIARNAVYSAFGLILCFFGLSALYLLWGATFISVVQILIYAGAIVVLFMFVVMLLNLGKTPLQNQNWLLLSVAGVSVWLFSFLLLRILSLGTVTGTSTAMENSMRAVSKLLFTRYLWPFEVLSVFLLVLIVAIFAIAHPDAERTKQLEENG